MMPSVKFIVETHIGVDRKGWIAPPEWIKWRADFFHSHTLESLKNQSFKDFEIFVQCGNRNKKMLKEYSWAPELTICFDQGKDYYDKIDTDYIAISRLDSDDLFHFEAMEEIKNNVILSNKRECLIFRQQYEWNIRNKWIRSTNQRESPFFTHIFPKSIYKNWRLFSSQHFVRHSIAGGRLPSTKELGNHKACCIQHWHNAGFLRRGKIPPIKSKAKIEELKKNRKDIIFDYDKIYSILKDFGITEQTASETQG